jgi:hypothetical protein
MERRAFLQLVPIGSAFLTGLVASSWIDASRANTLTLREQLEKGLKARLPEEFAFIDTVVTMVDNGTLPRDMVDGVFFWVRKNRNERKYMVPYFERLLRLKAKQVGITIP